jgi:UDP-hydrolysing UDP-N-acetyl-D-glucosamine 2-epimerase
VIEALRCRSDVDMHIIAATSALAIRFGAVVDRIRADGFTVAAELPSLVEGGGTRESAVSTGLLTMMLVPEFDRIRPDVVVTIADRHETLATAIAAAYQHIPLCHIQGGEVSGSIDDKVRNAVTQLADIHCVATSRARDRVLALRPGAQVHVTGCPSIDLAARALQAGPFRSSDFVVLQHPVTGEADRGGDQIHETAQAMRGLDVTWFWPGEDAGSEAMSKVLRMEGLHPIRNKPPVEFLRMLLGAKALVGNSSVGIRECSYLGVPVVNIGTRQEGRERGPNVLDVPRYEEGEISAALAIARQMTPMKSALYGDGRAGERIAAVLTA